MTCRTWFGLLLAGICFMPMLGAPLAPACCPVPPSGKPVVNADQTVIIIWDAANKLQHFIRQASFKSEADDFGFIVPSPSTPELEESGNDAFPYLRKLTEPEVIRRPRPTDGGGGCGCAAKAPPANLSRGLDDVKAAPEVKVLVDKKVAGFHAKVLEAKSATALVEWLKEHQYAMSPEVEAWAKPYVEQGWKFTALKVAKDPEGKEQKSVSTAALRISFKTDRPLFPYREPDTKSAAETLGASSRLLRIYFLGDARYKGELTKEVAWIGRVAWTNKLADEHRKKTLEMLKLPVDSGPTQWWLTEFEDNWPYTVAPADVYFSPDAEQSAVKRPPIIIYVSAPAPTSVAAVAFAALLAAMPLTRRLRRRFDGKS